MRQILEGRKLDERTKVVDERDESWTKYVRKGQKSDEKGRKSDEKGRRGRKSDESDGSDVYSPEHSTFKRKLRKIISSNSTHDYDGVTPPSVVKTLASARGGRIVSHMLLEMHWSAIVVGTLYNYSTVDLHTFTTVGNVPFPSIVSD
ncbi:hypothetical protein KP79_PYT19252 [Mizuhopecten yessoensis]|uniref:Uncharacterized protein n=1 Tax=Mizuhopecten yessoensis TaxID=6573 RepID=A0A210PSC8_MIZYE|nr:hypothetical protein KP79_PYT19252 [Mizuhopecten yessoensis]